MTNLNSKATNKAAPADVRAGAPILLAERDLEAVAAAGSKHGISGGSGATARM